MPEPLCVLFLMEDLCHGGTQRQGMELAKRLDRSQFSPQALTLTGPTDIDDFARANGVPVRHMGANRRLAPFFFMKLGKEIAAIHPDILVNCTALPNIWGRIWGKIRHVPVIVGTCRGGGAPRRQHEWLLWRLCHGIVCNSPALIAAMRKRGVPGARLRYIANGVDCQRFCPVAGPTPETPLILCVARLARDKDHFTLLKAFASVARQFPAARLRLVGDGPEAAHLASLAASLGAETGCRIEFAGASPDPAPHLREAAIFALSSLREGQPNAILEAMASGLPVCATNVGGIPDLVRGAGLLSPPGNAELLADNLCRLLADAGLRLRMGAIGRARAQNDFSFEAMTRAHAEFFLELWQKAVAA